MIALELKQWRKEKLRTRMRHSTWQWKHSKVIMTCWGNKGDRGERSWKKWMINHQFVVKTTRSTSSCWVEQRGKRRNELSNAGGSRINRVTVVTNKSVKRPTIQKEKQRIRGINEKKTAGNEIHLVPQAGEEWCKIKSELIDSCGGWQQNHELVGWIDTWTRYKNIQPKWNNSITINPILYLQSQHGNCWISYLDEDLRTWSLQHYYW